MTNFQNIGLYDIKRQSVVELAKYFNWEIDTKSSSQNYKVLRKGDEKIVVRTSGDIQLWTNNAGNAGSILDLVMWEKECSLGQAKVFLQAHFGAPQQTHTSSFLPPAAKASPATSTTVELPFISPKPATVEFLKGRHLATSIIKLAIKLGCVQSVIQHGYCNTVLVHSNANGLRVGGEVRNANWKSFIGLKTGLFQFSRHPAKKAAAIVVTESALDALAFSELHTDFNDLTVSTGGAPGKSQLATLKELLLQHPSIPVYLAQDNDAAGESQAQSIKASCESTGHRFIRLRPESGKDWCDVLTLEKSRQKEQEDEHE